MDVKPPSSYEDIEEGLKIKWTNPEGVEMNGNIAKLDKRMKKNVNIIIYEEDGTELPLKVPLSEIRIIN